MAGLQQILVLLALLLMFLVSASAGVTHSKIEGDSRAVILFGTFGFDATGHIDLNLTGLQIHHSDGDPSPVDRRHMGFFITTVEMEPQLEADFKHEPCILDDPIIVRLFTLDQVESDQGVQKEPFQLKFDVPESKEYMIFFANCQNTLVSMKVDLRLYNVEAGGKRDYLPSGQTQLPSLYFLFFLAYVVAGAAWAWLLRTQRETVQKIHQLMGILIIFKALTVLSQAAMYHYIKRTGSPDGWNIAFYIFSFFRGIMLFTVIVLIGTGWSFLKPFLQDKEKKVIMIVVPLQVFANIAVIILDETGPSSREWFTWRDILHLLDIICCCAILFPIVWSIKHLREAAHTDGKAARTLVKLTLFRQFYVMVVSYIYFTRIVVYLLESTTPYHWAWTAKLAEEVATLLFYSFTGWKFRPIPQNPYFALDDEEEEAAQQALRDEEFDL